MESVRGLRHSVELLVPFSGLASHLVASGRNALLTNQRANTCFLREAQHELQEWLNPGI